MLMMESIAEEILSYVLLDYVSQIQEILKFLSKCYFYIKTKGALF